MMQGVTPEGAPVRVPIPSAGDLPTAGEDPSALWLIAVVVVAVPFVLIAVLSWALHWHWLPALWFDYAWPSDKGNGPEALQQTIVYAAVAAVLVPAVRHFVAREFGKVHHKIDHVHATMVTHHDERKAEMAELHDHLHHLGACLGTEKFERKAPSE